MAFKALSIPIFTFMLTSFPTIGFEFGECISDGDALFSGTGEMLYCDPIERRPSGGFKSFITAFSFSFDNNSSSPGGVAFVLSSDCQLSSRGIGLMAVEFGSLMDSLLNSNCVWLNLGSMSSAASFGRDLSIIGVDLQSGLPTNTWIEYFGSTGELNVSVSYATSKPHEAFISTKISLGNFYQSESAFVGLTAGSTMAHLSVHSWCFDSEFDPSEIPRGKRGKGLGVVILRFLIIGAVGSIFVSVLICKCRGRWVVDLRRKLCGCSLEMEASSSVA